MITVTGAPLDRLEAELGAPAGLNLLAVALVPHALSAFLGCDPLGRLPRSNLLG
jgi:hypothetical protein